MSASYFVQRIRSFEGKMSSAPPLGPPGSDPSFNAAPRLLGVCYGVNTLSTVIVLLRLYTRAAIVKNVALDDHLLVISLVSSI